MAKLTDTLQRLTGDRRATVDAVTAAPTPLQPIDLTDDAVVAEVLDLAVRVGEVLLASGTGAMDTAEQVQFIAATYGLAQCDVDVTYNSIVLVGVPRARRSRRRARCGSSTTARWTSPVSRRSTGSRVGSVARPSPRTRRTRH